MINQFIRGIEVEPIIKGKYELPKNKTNSCVENKKPAAPFTITGLTTTKLPHEIT